MRLLPSSLFGRMLVLSLLASLVALVIAGVAISRVLERFVTGGIDARLGDRLVALQSAVRPDGILDRVQLVRVTARIAPDEPWRIELPGNTVSGGSDIVQIATPHHSPPPRRDVTVPAPKTDPIASGMACNPSKGGSWPGSGSTA